MIDNIYSQQEPSNQNDVLKIPSEFGRVQDVQKMFGIKRGILYRWIKENKIKSVCICEPGNKQGIRLIHLESVRKYIYSQMQHLNEEAFNA